MDSLIKPVELFKRAKELDQPAIAVTDHGSCAGLWDCLKASRDTGVKLIAGSELYFVDSVQDKEARLRHIILLAKNAQGYHNLLSLLKEGFDNFILSFKKPVPRVDWELLQKYREGLICTTACGNGILSQLINNKQVDLAKQQAQKLYDIFGDDLAIELQPHAMRRKTNLYGNEVDQTFTNRQLKKIAEELGIKCIVTTNAHYVRPEQYPAHDVMLAISATQPLNVGSRLKYNVNDFYIKSEEEVFNKLQRSLGGDFVRECINNTVYFADKCEFPDWIDPKHSNPSGKELPEFPIQEQRDYSEFKNWASANNLGYNNDTYLKYKCYEALDKKNYGKEYRARLEEELDVLCYCGVAGYMLIMMDLLEWCRNNNVSHGPGRGCLFGDALVLTSDGFKRLADINVGDNVYSHLGKERKVLKTFQYDIREECLEFTTRTSFGSIVMTKDHEVYASKYVNTCKKETNDYLNIIEMKKGYSNPSWIKASELERGDAIFSTFPIQSISKAPEFDLKDFINGHNYEVDEKYIYIKRNSSKTFSLRLVSSNTGISFEKLRKYKTLNKSLSEDDEKTLSEFLCLNNLTIKAWLASNNIEIIKVPRKVKINDDIAYLLGRWVGDGSFHGRLNDGRGITIAFNVNDNVGINKVCSIIKTLGLNPIICKPKNGNGLNVTVAFYPLYSLIRNIIPNYTNSYNKHLPIFFRRLDSKLLKSLLQGLHDADGYLTKSKHSIKTTSVTLASEIKELLLYLKIPSTVYYYKNYRYGKRTHDTCNVLYNPTPINNKGYYSKIVNIEPRSVNKVYDLNVDVDSSYLTSNYVVHNSVGGSLVAYLLGIHNADPIQYGLVFARFHNKLKQDYSDIDEDFSARNRYKAIEYITNKYGTDNVAAISNYNTLTPKVYVKAIARTFEYGGDRKTAVKVGMAIADSISNEAHTIKAALSNSPLFAEYAKRYTELEQYSEIGGVVAAVSTHAAGIIINKRSLSGLVPLRRDKDGNPSVEYEKDRVEENGLVKMDFLGLSTLDVIDDTYDLIKASGKEIKPFDYNVYDKAAYDLISRGDTFCVFQLGTSTGTMNLCKRYAPQNMEDLAIITTLARPAAKDIREDFFKTKNGTREVQLLHPKLERAFKSTRGFALFDESLLYLTEDICAWDLHEADSLRKLTKAKGKYPERAQEIKESFISDAIKNGLSKKESKGIWDKVVDPFQKYSFNKSHAVLYSMISYHTAWLKAHYPLEFLVASLINKLALNSPIAKNDVIRIKKEIRKLNIKILPPNINTSEMSYKIVDDQTLLTGFDALKSIGKKAIPEILAKRPFNTFEEFLSRIDGRAVTVLSVRALAASGCLDSFGLTRKQMYLYASDFKKKIQVHVKRTDEPFKYPWPEDIGEWGVPELHALEREFLGEGITGDKFEVYGGFFTKTAPSFRKFDQIHPPPPDDMTDKEQRKYAKHITMVQAEVKSFFEFKVKKEDSKLRGEVMAKVVLEDPWGNQMAMTCFPDGWVHLQNRVAELLNNKYKLTAGTGLYINGDLNWYEGDISLIFGDIARCCPPPQLPKDRDDKKVCITRAKRSKKTEEVTDRDSLLEEVEAELIDGGHSDLDDDDEEMDGFI